MSDEPRASDSIAPGDETARAVALRAEAVSYGPARASARGVRLVAGIVAVCCAALLTTASVLRPDPRGFGTHQQLGQGPCGMLVWTGLPCPTCGMTTAFAYTVRGRLLAAARAQPSGMLLALGCMAAIALSIGALATGRWYLPRGLAGRPHLLFVTLLVLLVGGWAYKLAAGFATGELPVTSLRVSPLPR